MRFTCELPDHAAAVEMVLDALVEVTRVLIRADLVPPFPHDVVGVRYQLEPAGEEDWKLPPGVIRDGWGDCEDLAIWMCAGLRETEEDPEAYVRIVRTARNKLHAVVQRSDGRGAFRRGSETYDDPSVDLMTDADKRRFTDA